MNMQQMMRQAQKMQKQMEQLQEEAALEIIEVSSGGGMVKVKMNGRQEVQGIEIEDEILSDKEVLQDLIIAAVNEATRRTQEFMQSKMRTLTGGLNLPGIF
jgi:DNA-binding YbaB/EbfC family protein